MAQTNQPATFEIDQLADNNTNLAPETYDLGPISIAPGVVGNGYNQNINDGNVGSGVRSANNSSIPLKNTNSNLISFGSMIASTDV